MPNDSWCTAIVKEAVLEWLKRSYPDKASFVQVTYQSLKDGKVLLELLQLIQSTSNEVTFSQSRIPSRPAARFAKIDVFIQAAAKIGAIYSLNIGAILNEGDEQELCKCAILLLFLGSFDANSPILTAATGLPGAHQTALQNVLSVIQNNPEPMLGADPNTATLDILSTPTPSTAASSIPRVSEPADAHLSRLRSTGSPLVAQLLSSPFQSSDRQRIYTEYRKIKLENLSLQDEVEICKADLEAAVKQFEEEKTQMQQRLQDLRERGSTDNSCYEAEVKRLEEENASLQQKLTQLPELELRVNSLSEICETDTVLIKDLKKEKEDLVCQLQKVEAGLIQYQEAHSEYSSQVEKLNFQVEEQKSLLQSKDCEIAALQQLTSSLDSGPDTPNVSRSGENLGDILLMEAETVKEGLLCEIKQLKEKEILQTEKLDNFEKEISTLKLILQDISWSKINHDELHVELERLSVLKGDVAQMLSKLVEEKSEFIFSSENTVAKLQSELSVLAEANLSFKKTVEENLLQLQTECDGKSKALDELAFDKQKTENELLSVHSKLDSLSKVKQGLEEKLLSVQKELENVESIKADVDGRLTALLQEKEDSEIANNEEKCQLKVAVEHAQTAKEKFELESRELQLKVASLESELSHQTQENSTICEKLESLMSDNGLLNDKIMNMERDHAEHTESSDRKYDQLMVLKTSLEQQLSEVSLEASNFRKAAEENLIRLQADCDGKSKALDELALDKQQTENELLSVQSKFDSLSQVKQELEEKLLSVQKELDNVESIKADVDGRLTALLKEKEDSEIANNEERCQLKVVVEHAQTAKEKLELESRELQLKVASLESELSHQTQENSTICEKLDSLMSDNTLLNDKIMNMERDHAEHTESSDRKYDQLMVLKTSLEQQLSEVNVKASNFKNETSASILKLQTECDDKSKAVEEFARNEKILKCELTKLRGEITSLSEVKQDLDELKTNNGLLEQQFIALQISKNETEDKLKGELSDLKIKLEQFEERNATLLKDNQQLTGELIKRQEDYDILAKEKDAACKNSQEVLIVGQEKQSEELKLMQADIKIEQEKAEAYKSQLLAMEEQHKLVIQSAEENNVKSECVLKERIGKLESDLVAFAETSSILERYKIGYKEKKQIIEELKHQLKVAKAEQVKFQMDAEQSQKKYLSLQAEMKGLSKMEQSMRASIATVDDTKIKLSDLESTGRSSREADTLQQSRRKSLHQTGKQPMALKTYGDDEADVLIDATLQPSEGSSIFAESAVLTSETRERVDDPNERISEFQKRNSKYLPHLRSAYPIESQVYTPSKPKPDVIRDGGKRRQSMAVASTSSAVIEGGTTSTLNEETAETFSLKRSNPMSQTKAVSSSPPKKCMAEVVDERVNKGAEPLNPVPQKPAEAFAIPNTPKASRRKSFKAKFKSITGKK